MDLTGTLEMLKKIGKGVVFYSLNASKPFLIYQCTTKLILNIHEVKCVLSFTGKQIKGDC